MRTLAAKDWAEFRRDRRLWLAAVLTVLLALVAVLAALAEVARHEADRVAATELDRRTWESQGARNPHTVAHFAEWAFRPLTGLAVLDPGLTPFAGNAIWMEAHNSNPAGARPSADRLWTGPPLSTAWLVQLLLPLVLFAIGAGLVAREREQGTLRLLLSGGQRGAALLAGKALGLWRTGVLIALPIVAAAGLASAVAAPADPLRLGLWVVAHTAWLALVAVLAVLVSARARATASALVALAALWLLMALVVPRAAAALASALYPAPTAEALAGERKAMRARVPDVFGKDAEAFGAAMARRYGVARVEDLPVSLEGLQLDAAERQDAALFRHERDRLDAIHAQQQGVMRTAAIVSPLIAVQNISMALAGTDLAHQQAFEKQAEAHRLSLVHALNRDMILKAGDQGFDYRADPALWKAQQAFRFTPPSLAITLRSILPDLAVLLGWAGLLLLLLRHAGRKLDGALVQ